MEKWLTLSGSLYLFSGESINRVEQVDSYMHDGSKSEYVTTLYNKTTPITKVRETVEEIKEMLK